MTVTPFASRLRVARAHAARDERTRDLLNELAGVCRAPAGRPYAERHDRCPARCGDLRQAVTEVNMCVADALTQRYSGRGVDADDLRQAAYLGLIQAVASFDPARGVNFLVFAVPTITGAIRHYFRDHSWDIRPSRRVQDLRRRVFAVAEQLRHDVGRSARPHELAELLGVHVDEVIECLTSGDYYNVTSLDAEVRGATDGPGALADVLGMVDTRLEVIEMRVSVVEALRHLTVRERRALMLRFFGDWTQERIGRELGVSQMQVSRILSGALQKVRDASGVNAAA